MAIEKDVSTLLDEYRQITDVSGAFEAASDTSPGTDGNNLNTYRLTGGVVEGVGRTEGALEYEEDGEEVTVNVGVEPTSYGHRMTVEGGDLEDVRKALGEDRSWGAYFL